MKIWGVCEAPGALEVLDTWRLAMCVWLTKAQMLLSPRYSPDITSQAWSAHSFCFGGRLFHPSSIHCVIVDWIWFRLPLLGGRSYVSAFYTWMTSTVICTEHRTEEDSGFSVRWGEWQEKLRMVCHRRGWHITHFANSSLAHNRCSVKGVTGH